MAIIIDNFELDETNLDFIRAANFVSETNELIFLTGKAGTGKTTFLKYIKSITDKNTVVVAPTGVAAINAGGVTIHSFFQVPFGPFVPDDKRLRTSKNFGDSDNTTIFTTFKYRDNKRSIIEALDLLIIDEISMVRCDMLDVIDKVLRAFRNKPNIPFGGVQVLLIGDVFQLPPIAKYENKEWDILKPHYKNRFFFSSKIMELLIYEKKYVHFELKKIYRQTEQEFIDLLNRVRVNELIESDLKLLEKKYNPSFLPSNSDTFIVLSTHNSQVDLANKNKLDELNTDLIEFEGELKGEFPKNSEGKLALPTDLTLQLKVGAQVMFLKNDYEEIKRYFNGKIGIVKTLSDKVIVVEFSDGSTVPVEKAKWENIEYNWNKEKKKVEEIVKGEFIQYPLRLAWVITVHKSQGLTFEKVFADLGGAFEDGQVYVALSRCKSLAGLELKTKIPKSAIRASIEAIEFSKNETPETLITKQLNEGKADFYYKKSREALKRSDFTSAFDYFLKATKFRNDIEIKDFKRYFITTASRLSLSKKNQTIALVKLQEAENRIHELDNAIESERNSLSEMVNDMNSTIDTDQIIIKEQNNTINSLSITNSKLEKLNNENSNFISDLQNEINSLNKDLNISRSKVNKQESIIIEQKVIIKNQLTEIERQKSLKWHQKLIGKK